MKVRLPLIEFLVLAALVLGLIGWFHPIHRLELLSYKAAMAAVIGPAIGMLIHRLCVPGDRISESGDPRVQDNARWRRVACIATASLVVGLGL